MKKNKSELVEVGKVLTQQVDKASLKGELLALIEASISSNNARSFKYMIHYYGLNGVPGLTLEAIGTEVAGGLTRERVRQIIDGALSVLVKAESSNVVTPYKETKRKFDAMIEENQSQFLRLSEFVNSPYFSGFGPDPKGLIALLNDAGIRQVVYRNEHYIYPKHIDRRSAIEMVQVENKKYRRAKTVEKMGKMAKTVTYVPTETRELLLASAEKLDMPLNRLYEKILIKFMQENKCKGSDDYEKTQSWRARKGKAEWSQVGIYIDKAIFDQVKGAALKIKPEAISNMSYICQAFVSYTKGQLKI